MSIRISLFICLISLIAQAESPLVYIARTHDTTGDNLVDVDDLGQLFLFLAGDERSPLALTGRDMDVMRFAWSPDGSALAFHAHYADTDGDHSITRDDAAAIFVIRLEGEAPEPVRLTGARADERAPTWSPDGRRLAFVVHQAGAASIDLIEADCDRQQNCNRTRQTLIREPGFYLDPAWSPDGRYIAFLALEDTRPDGILNRFEDLARLMLVEVDTGTAHSLTSAHSLKSAPLWSPDGAVLVYSAITDTDGDGHIDALYDHAALFMVRPDTGHAPQRITDPAIHATDPAWSPDSAQLAYSALTDTNGDGQVDPFSDSPNIFAIAFDGTAWGEPRPLTADATLDYMPAWSADSAQIAFVGLRVGAGGGVGTSVNRRAGVFIVDVACGADCSPRRVSPEAVDAALPLWSP